MSLLAPLPSNNLPAAMRIRAEVGQIKSAPRRLTDHMVREWERAFDQVWTVANGITPAMRIAELGKDAAELFAASTALITFLITMLSGKDDATVARLMAKAATAPAYTVNPDGSVTID